MAPETYKAALMEAKRDLAECITELGSVQLRGEQLELQIYELRRTISSLARLCGEEEYIEEDELGLTDSVRLALKTAGEKMTPQGIRARLQTMGFDIFKYGNLLAAIHTVLKRLVEQGQAQDVGNGNYSWIGGSPTREEQLEATKRFQEATARRSPDEPIQKLAEGARFRTNKAKATQALKERLRARGEE